MFSIPIFPREVSSFKPNPPQEKRLIAKGEGVDLVDEESAQRESERLRQREENYEEEEEEEDDGRGREEGRKRKQDGVKKLSPSEAVMITHPYYLPITSKN